jgi:hypothetical protein
VGLFKFRNFHSAAVIATGLVALSMSMSLGASRGAAAPEEHEASGSMKIMISLNDQRLNVYRGTELVSSTRVSTGKAGHRTPTGVFSILQKRKWHRSNIYSNAPMPYMQRLTWSGIALHEGYVPNYAASHGCIRIPGGFARKLFSSTRIGVHVVVSQEETKPVPITHSGLLQPRPLELITMDERKALVKWMNTEKPSTRWIPLPVKASSARFQLVSMSTGDSERKPAQAPARTVKKLSPREASLKMADLEYDLEQLNFYAEKSDEPLRILITQREQTDRVRDVQTMLLKLGYDAGEADGYIGQQTRKALRDYEKANEMEPSGEISKALVDKLHIDAKQEPVMSGHLYVRQAAERIFDAPVQIKDPETPLGTYLFTIRDFEPWDDQAKWLTMTAKQTQEGGARAALDRIELPAEVRGHLEKLLTPGSSLIISDGGLGPQAHDAAGFIALTN